MNAIVIEQSPEETKRAFEVHQNGSIHRVRLARAKVASQAFDTVPEGRVAVTFDFKSRQLNAPANILRLEIAFRMAGIAETEGAEPEEKPEPVVLVECAYEVDYVLREEFEVTPEQVRAFKDGNAIFNVWPYFREYLQNNLQRMGLPSLTAPFLRLQPRAKGQKRKKAGDLGSGEGAAPGLGASGDSENS